MSVYNFMNLYENTEIWCLYMKNYQLYYFWGEARSKNLILLFISCVVMFVSRVMETVSMETACSPFPRMSCPGSTPRQP